MKRYKKFVLEAEKGITSEILERTREDTANVYSTNYVNPPIPEGFI